MRIAFLDSGIGGITVLNEALKQLPDENYLFFADTLHVPYGTKSMEEVNACVKQSVDIIMNEQVKALVIACNTATSSAISELRSSYSIPIIGMEPAVKPAVEMNRTTGKRVLVLATELTLKQSKYTELVSRVDDQCIVDSMPLPELVEHCEALNFDRKNIQDFFTTKLAAFDLDSYGTIVLGCTHFPYYTDILKEMLPEHIQVVDGNAGTVNRLSQVLQSTDRMYSNSSSRIEYMCSNNDPEYIKKMKRAMEILHL
ncbi:glutamate racemase [Paenibacillus wynnii]|uniref:Glutamate racemase n=1 Tax=Paenibacillus wynnii TaxID=268407 RepID=A0A098M2V9_9BACL|nr:glutamate racemase [Paenibacillus wynnii]KGE16794.1 glutamate racemase [Paenibacillus wynnii]